MIDKQTLIRRASFTVYFIAIFLIFLLFLFPFDRVKSMLESEVRARTPFELSVAHISPRFFNRFVLSDVVLSDKQGKVLFESPSVKTRISLFSLIFGGFSGTIKAAAYGGEVTLKLKQKPGTQYVLLDVNGLDIGSYGLLRDAGIKLTGKVGGNFELNNDSGKGRFWLKNATMRDVKLKGFAVPDVDFDKGWLDTEVKGDRLTVKKLELEGKQLKVQITGDMILRDRGTLNLSVKLKPSEVFVHEQPGYFAVLQNRDPDGYYLFSVGGLLTEPMPRF